MSFLFHRDLESVSSDVLSVFASLPTARGDYTHRHSHTHSSSCIVPPGVPVAPTLPYRGSDKETIIYLLSITINLRVRRRPSRLSPVCVCVCVCVSVCVPRIRAARSYHTHTHLCLACVCVGGSQCAVCDPQTSDSMLGMRR